jgi:putative glycosyltransferase (TIGR04372 family)
MKKIIENFFRIINFYFYTPKLDTYGGFITDIIDIEKIRKYKKSKSIICVVINPYYYKGEKNSSVFFPSKDILFSLIKSLSFSEKILSIFFSLVLNTFIFINKFIFFTKLKRFFFFYLGYSSRVLGNFEYLQFNQNKNYVLTKVYCENLNLKQTKKKNNYLTLCVKDINYKKIKPTMTDEAAANINDYIDSIKYLNKKFVILRIGDPTMDKFEYKNKNFFDFTDMENHFEMQFDSCFKSKFYFGTAGSHSYIPSLTNTKRYMTNCVDFHGLQSTFEYDSYLIFKKIYDLKQKKILSLEEIYLDNHVNDMFDSVKKNNFIYIDNTKEENLLLAQEIDKYNKNIENYEELKQFEEIRSKYLKNINTIKIMERSENLNSLKYAYCSIPKWYLKKFLFQNKYLEELSKQIQTILFTK